MSTDANARGRRPTLGHIRGLDGIRALSVLAIIAFHTGLNSVPGGFYGVDSFFVLSGFLITSLLLKEWGGSGTIRLRRFWAGRARRLLPALFLLVAMIGIVMAVVPRLLQTPHIIGDAVSTIFYFSNWYSIHGGVTYFALVEPAVAAAAHVVAGDRGAVLPGVAARGAGRAEDRATPRRASLVARCPAVGARPARRVGRRCSAGGRLLVGDGPHERDPEWTRRRRLHVLFAVACLGLFGLGHPHGLPRPERLHDPGLLRHRQPCPGAARRGGHRHRADAVARGQSAPLVHTAVPRCWPSRAWQGRPRCGARRRRHRPSPSAAGSSWRACWRERSCSAARWPRARSWSASWNSHHFPQWGRISYGVYLWYWPVLLVLTGQRLHWGVYPLFLARVGITVAIAAISYDFVEMPIRRGALRRWRSWIAAPIGAVAAISAVFVSTLMPVGATVLEGSQLQRRPPTTTTSTSTTTSTTPATAASSTSRAAAPADPRRRRRRRRRPPPCRRTSLRPCQW